MNRTKTVITALVALVVLGVAVAGFVWWQAGDDEVSEAGSCDGASYTLETEREGDTTEVSFEVQAGEPGQTWEVVIEHDGEPLVEGSRTTDEDAEIDVDAYLPQDASGEVTARATHGDQVCTATLGLG